MFNVLSNAILRRKQLGIHRLRKSLAYENSKISAANDISNKLTNAQDGKQRQALKRMVINFLNNERDRYNLLNSNNVNNLGEFLSNRSNFGIADVLKVGHKRERNKLRKIQDSKLQYLALKLANLELKRKYVAYDRVKIFHGERMFNKKVKNALERWS